MQQKTTQHKLEPEIETLQCVLSQSLSVRRRLLGWNHEDSDDGGGTITRLGEGSKERRRRR
jgi:hypothetical protein